MFLYSGNPKIKRGLLKSAKKEKSRKSCDLQDSLRRERDSNPRYLSVRRFSRPVHSTTLPSLHRVFEIAVLAVKKVNHLKASLHCGERGIRTPGTSQYAGFQDRCIRPLCHLSNSLDCIVAALSIVTFRFTFAGAKVVINVGFAKLFIKKFHKKVKKSGSSLYI